MRIYHFFILLIASACVSKSQTARSIFGGTWLYNPELISDTLTISDDFAEIEGHSTEYLIHSDSGWNKHIYSDNQELKIIKTDVFFCMQFDFKNDNIGQIITYRLDSSTQIPPELLAFENLNYEFHLTDSSVSLIDMTNGTEFEHKYELLDANRLIWDNDTLIRINMP